METGFVTAQPVTRPKYQVPPTFGQPQEMVVDITAKVNGQTINYAGLPAQSDIADTISNGDSIVISDSKEAMNAEILSLKQKSLDVINSVDFHRNLANSCDKILSDLNPEFAEKQAQREEIDSLKAQMSEMSKNIGDLMEANRKLIEQLSKKEN